MRQAPIEALLLKITPLFAMVNAVATRAEELGRGDIPAIETNTRNPVLIAMEELALGRLRLGPTRKAAEPPRDMGREKPSAGSEAAASARADAVVSVR